MTIPLPDYFLPHTATVRGYASGGGMGGGYLPARDVSCFVEDRTETVRGADGSETISNTQVHLNFDEVVPIDSLVTVWPGITGQREAPVVAIGRGQHPTLPSFQTLYLK
ncbi:hypothetical protein NB037_03110 [Rathayibacter sp. ZW T2_19]|uniref:Uncharacterized protein n=1 Tax=Rathayibacter rubneri TaxID=2950106 RepID=A0A9X2IRZ2_9MICO|nr:hypothetical protein [Rathayibacter rubneri]MCM6761397.1 hypothetical protein [Rathayibacter rubneri]